MLCRPYYLPHKISCVLLIVVYVPGKSEHSGAAKTITQHVNDIKISHPDAAMGNVNWCAISQHL